MIGFLLDNWEQLLIVGAVIVGVLVLIGWFVRDISKLDEDESEFPPEDRGAPW